VDESLIVAAAGLRSRYAEPHRSYHNQAHVDTVLTVVDDLAEREKLTDEDRAVVRLAAWFHDAVYDPRATDNEQRSADLVREVLPAAGLDPNTTDEVTRLVMVTAEHVVAPGDVRAAVLCDSDLSVLGAQPESYDAYARQVREEYAHVPETVFAYGRSAVLTRLLAAGSLFTTTTAHDRWETQARANLARERAGWLSLRR